MCKKPMINLDFESREIFKKISEEYNVDIDLLIQAYLIGSLKTLEMLETIAMSNLFNDDYELLKDVSDKNKMN